MDHRGDSAADHADSEAERRRGVLGIALAHAARVAEEVAVDHDGVLAPGAAEVNRQVDLRVTLTIPAPTIHGNASAATKAQRINPMISGRIIATRPAPR